MLARGGGLRSGVHGHGPVGGAPTSAPQAKKILGPKRAFPAKTQAPSGVRAEPARASEDQDEPAVKMPPRRATRRTRVPDDQNDDADDEARDGAANMRSLFADAEAAAAEQAPAAPAWATRRRRTRA